MRQLRRARSLRELGREQAMGTRPHSKKPHYSRKPHSCHVAPAAGDEEHIDVATQAFEVISAALAGYRLEGTALIHAVRMWRAACHGMTTLQTAGGFGLPESVDMTFGHLVDALDTEFGRLGALG